MFKINEKFKNNLKIEVYSINSILGIMMIYDGINLNLFSLNDYKVVWSLNLKEDLIIDKKVSIIKPLIIECKWIILLQYNYLFVIDNEKNISQTFKLNHPINDMIINQNFNNLVAVKKDLKTIKVWDIELVVKINSKKFKLKRDFNQDSTILKISKNYKLNLINPVNNKILFKNKLNQILINDYLGILIVLFHNCINFYSYKNKNLLYSLEISKNSIADFFGDFLFILDENKISIINLINKKINKIDLNNSINISENVNFIVLEYKKYPVLVFQNGNNLYNFNYKNKDFDKFYINNNELIINKQNTNYIKNNIDYFINRKNKLFLISNFVNCLKMLEYCSVGKISINILNNYNSVFKNSDKLILNNKSNEVKILDKNLKIIKNINLNIKSKTIIKFIIVDKNYLVIFTSKKIYYTNKNNTMIKKKYINEIPNKYKIIENENNIFKLYIFNTKGIFKLEIDSYLLEITINPIFDKPDRVVDMLIDNNYLFLIFKDGFMKIITLNTRIEIKTISINIEPDFWILKNNYLFICYLNGNIGFFQITNVNNNAFNFQKINYHNNKINSIVIKFKINLFFVIGDSDGIIAFWNIKNYLLGPLIVININLCNFKIFDFQYNFELKRLEIIYYNKVSVFKISKYKTIRNLYYFFCIDFYIFCTIINLRIKDILKNNKNIDWLNFNKQENVFKLNKSNFKIKIEENRTNYYIKSKWFLDYLILFRNYSKLVINNFNYKNFKKHINYLFYLSLKNNSSKIKKTWYKSKYKNMKINTFSAEKIINKMPYLSKFLKKKKAEKNKIIKYKSVAKYITKNYNKLNTIEESILNRYKDKEKV